MAPKPGSLLPGLGRSYRVYSKWPLHPVAVGNKERLPDVLTTGKLTDQKLSQIVAGNLLAGEIILSHIDVSGGRSLHHIRQSHVGPVQRAAGKQLKFDFTVGHKPGKVLLHKSRGLFGFCIVLLPTRFIVAAYNYIPGDFKFLHRQQEQPGYRTEHGRRFSPGIAQRAEQGFTALQQLANRGPMAGIALNDFQPLMRYVELFGMAQKEPNPVPGL